MPGQEMLLQNGDFLDDANRPEAVLRIGVSWLGVGRHGATGLEAELIGRLATF